MKLKTIGLAVGCVLLGIVLGRMLPGLSPSSTMDDMLGKDIGVVSSGSSSTKTSERNMPDWPVSPERSGSQGSRAAETSGRDEEMVWIPSSLLEELSADGGARTVGQNLFSGDGKIEEALKITDQEKTMIQAAWKKTQQKMRELEVSAMTSEVSEGGSVVTITVPDLSTDLREVGQGFGSEIRNSLGENRAAVFLAVKQVDRMFSPEASERTYRIEPESTGDGGWRYHMTLEGGGNRRVWVSETIPEQISHLTDVASIRRTLAEE